MVPGSSTSSSSSFPSSTPMTPSRQEIDHPTSSSSSSAPPTMTSSTVSSDSVTGQARRDLCGIDSYPVTVSSKHVERQARVRSVFFWNPRRENVDYANQKSNTKKKTKTTIKNGETCYIPTYFNGCKNSEKILWMTEFLSTETRTAVLLTNHL